MTAVDVASPHLLQKLKSARAETDRLFAILTPEAIYERPIAERHRVIFYIGHLDGFDAIQICREGLGLKSSDEEFDDLFQAGIDPDSGHLPSDTPSDWPSLSQVLAYRDRCRQRVDESLDRASDEIVSMAIEHRFMHLETLAYMLHNFDHDLKVKPFQSSCTPVTPRLQNEWRDIPKGEAVLGKKLDASFGWDNEYAEVRVTVPTFRIQRFPVTNGDYLRFVNETGAPPPHFWLSAGSDFLLKGMFENVALPLDWPVYVTELEAESYARWLGKDLPTEEQFHRAAYATPHTSPGRNHRLYPWGDEPPTHDCGNFDFKAWDPESVYATPNGDSYWGVSQLVGNGWEWTRSAFAPFPGFKARASYPGYSSNFFDGDHYVIKGGSSRTASELLRPSFRNWFRRDYPYVYAKFRCVEN